MSGPSATETLPHNVELEQTILGALMLNNDLMSHAPDLTDAQFHDPVHGRIFEALRVRIAAGDLASPVTLQFALGQDDGLKELGGPRYLARLAAVAMIAGFADAVRQLQGLWARRALIEAVDQIRPRLLADDGSPVSRIASDMEADLASIAHATTRRPLISSWLVAMSRSIDQINIAYQGDGFAGVSTGLKSLDDKVGGLRPGDLMILAGRPSMGKTGVALNIAVKAALRGEGVLFASLEMPGEQLANRFYSQILAERGQYIAYSNIRNGRMSETEFRAVIETAKEFEALPLVTAEPEVRDLSRLRSAIKRAEATLNGSANGLSLIVIDYLQKIQVAGARSTYERVSQAVSTCKSLAMTHQVPVICLSQLSRGVEARENKRPILSDLRESGEIEQEADLVVFCYRHAYCLERQIEAAGTPEKRADLEAALALLRTEIELIIGKQRAGEVGTVIAECDVRYNLLRDRQGEMAFG